MIGKGQDKPLVPEGLTHREMIWFKKCGRNIHGEWSKTCGIIKSDNECRRTLTTKATDGEEIQPLRTILFAMDVIIRNQLEDIKSLVAEREEKCGSHHCNDCGKCEPF